MNESKKLNWAILGCGVVANEMAVACASAGRNIYAVANRTYEKAVAFAEKYQVEKVYESYEEMLLDPSVDVVYITTPHNTHINYMIKALEHGKHILCEKSITLNSNELEQAMKLAKDKNLIIAEAMTIYHMPLHRELRERITTGCFGEVRMIQMNFGSYKEYDMTNRFFNRNLAGGALLDIGVYAISFVRWYMKTKPTSISSQVRFAPSGVDEQVGILLMNEDKEMATISLSLHSKQPKRGMISCDKAYIEINEYPRGEEAVITYTESGEREIIQLGSRTDALYYELLDMEKSISSSEDFVYLNYSQDVMDIMTRIRKDWDMSYPEEE